MVAAAVHKVKIGKKIRKLLKDVWRASALLVPAKKTKSWKSRTNHKSATDFLTADD